MPIHNNQYQELGTRQTLRPGLNALTAIGPLLQIEVHVPRALAVLFFEVAHGPHGVDEVVGGVDTAERGFERVRVQDITADHLRLG